ncbi:hypothetical protein P1J78_24905, partial [Psychromarinibacter sp. C21-152]
AGRFLRPQPIMCTGKGRGVTLMSVASHSSRMTNYLILERKGGDWTSRWDLETSGMTGPLALGRPTQQ